MPQQLEESVSKRLIDFIKPRVEQRKKQIRDFKKELKDEVDKVDSWTMRSHIVGNFNTFLVDHDYLNIMEKFSFKTNQRLSDMKDHICHLTLYLVRQEFTKDRNIEINCKRLAVSEAIQDLGYMVSIITGENPVDKGRIA